MRRTRNWERGEQSRSELSAIAPGDAREEDGDAAASGPSAEQTKRRSLRFALVFIRMSTCANVKL